MVWQQLISYPNSVPSNDRNLLDTIETIIPVPAGPDKYCRLGYWMTAAKELITTSELLRLEMSVAQAM
jgi:hypothetical protein